MQMISYVQSTHPHLKEVPEKTTVYKAVGCERCGGTGYKGRTGIFEAVVMDEAVEEAILRDPREHVILDAAAPQGIPTMTQDGIRKLLEGLTSLTELERVIELPYQLASAPIEKPPVAKETLSDESHVDDFQSHIV